MHSLISNNKRKRKRSKYLTAQYELKQMINAPTELEEKYCVCGERLAVCKHAYLHMSKGY